MAADPLPPSPNRVLLLFIVSAILCLFAAAWTLLALNPEGTIDAFDRRCAHYWQRHDDGGTRQIMLYLTEVGGVGGMTMLTAMAAVWQRSHGRRTFVVIWVAIVIGGAILNQTLKYAFDRDRPPERNLAVWETNKSYPSGHAMGSVIGFGMLCYAQMREMQIPRRRTATILFFALLVGGIGMSRIYLRAHWFSDVIAGYTMGLCWLCFCLAWVERQRVRQRSPRVEP
jgi:undecaprenyl-diphosphatase